MLSTLWRRAWMRWALRGVHYSDRHNKLDALYRMPDPWNMDNAGERYRFEQTNRLIESHIAGVRSLLEVGCGEGHQSRQLLGVCERLYGIDVSRRAVERAELRCPEGTFAVGDIFTCDMLKGMERVDLVVACEVIYYMADVPRAIERMSQLGRTCLVTYYDAHAERLGPQFEGLAGAERSRFRHEDKVWHAVWWPGAARAATSGPAGMASVSFRAS